MIKDFTFVIFSIPYTYPSINEWTTWHWSKRNRVKKDFITTMAFAINEQGITPFHVPVKIYIDLIFPKKRRRDLDNYSPKFLLDSLVQCGIIPDDSSDWIPESPDVQIYIDKINRIDVKIEAIK